MKHLLSCGPASLLFLARIALLLAVQGANSAPLGQQAFLKASDPGYGGFGTAVAVSGETIVIGAPGEGWDSGAAYVFVRGGSSWIQQAYLKASDITPGFGRSVAISGDTIVVGAHHVLGSESAYVFVRTGTNWAQQAHLNAPVPEISDGFGIAVAISGSTIVVGAPGEDSAATGVNGNQNDNSAQAAGAAYTFVRNGTNWTLQAYLKASNTGMEDFFGWSVAISENTVVVGAYGEGSNATGVNGNQFNNSAASAGAAYVFVRSGTNWSQQAYLKASNTESNDWFGWSVAISENTVVVGATEEDSNATGVNGNQADNSVLSVGAAYVFVRNGTAWSQQAYLKPSISWIGDAFGQVSVWEDTIVVGAERHYGNIGIGAGAAFVFVRAGTTWSQQAYLRPNVLDSSDFFGRPAVSGTLVVVGARGEGSSAGGVNADQCDNRFPGAGAAYVFDEGAVFPVAPEIAVGINLIDNTGMLDFGTAPLGVGPGRGIMISNVGNASLTDLAATITGPHASDFILSPPAPVLAPCYGTFGTTSIGVIFSPSAVGPRTALLRITSSDADESQIDITLSGTGITPFVAAEQTYVKASYRRGAQFGYSVAVDGDTMVVGAPLDASNATGVNGNGDQVDVDTIRSGAAYVYVFDGATWHQQAYLKASNTGFSNFFGSNVAISGDTIVVGAITEDSAATGVQGSQEDNSASGAGAAYVFVRTGTNWSQQAYLKASNTDAGDLFGSVAISGDTIVVGASREASNATGVNGNQTNNFAAAAGAAYVFVRTGTNWTQQAYLKASNAQAQDRFGLSVAISADTVVIGAFLESSNAKGVNGNQDNNNAIWSGAAYVFVRNGTNWAQQAYLKASNTEYDDEFGTSVSVSGDTVVVGAWAEDSANSDESNNTALGSGAAYVFVRRGTNWSQQAYLKPSIPDALDQFGWSVAVSGDLIAVTSVGEDSSASMVNGNGNDDSLPESGAAYVFTRQGDTWNQRGYLKASNTGREDFFGFSVAASGDTVVVGAPFEDSGATGVNGDSSDNSAPNAGAVYVFTRVPPPAILAQPTDQAVLTGSSATFSVVVASTNPPIEYQWRFNGSNLPAATNASLTVSNAQLADLGDYQVVVSDTVGSVNSAVASLNLLYVLFITSQPVSRAVHAGSTATFNVEVYGTAPLHYQWRLNEVDLPNGTNATLSIPNVQEPQLGEYIVVITNNYGAVTSTVATLTILTPPIIVQQPQSLTVIAGENATFSVTVTNTAALPINYQWRKGSTPLTNMWLSTTQSSFTLFNVQTNVTSTNGPGLYRVVITNAATAGLPSSLVALTVLTATPPVVVTGDVTNLSSDGATLFGSVNPLGSTTTIRFDYGLTTNYGASTPPVVIGNGTNSISVSNVLTGLSAGTTYHYRLVGANGGGSTTGMDRTFATAVSGPVLTLVPDGSGGYFLRFTGIPGLSYRSLRAPVVVGPWTNVNTQIAPASGLIEYHDTTPLPGQGFYRVVQP